MLPVLGPKRHGFTYPQITFFVGLDIDWTVVKSSSSLVNFNVAALPGIFRLRRTFSGLSGVGRLFG